VFLIGFAAVVFRRDRGDSLAGHQNRVVVRIQGLEGPVGASTVAVTAGVHMVRSPQNSSGNYMLHRRGQAPQCDSLSCSCHHRCILHTIHLASIHLAMPPRAEGRCYIVAEAAVSAREVAGGRTWRQGTAKRTIQGDEVQVDSEGRGVNLAGRSHARRGVLRLRVSLSIPYQRQERSASRRIVHTQVTMPLDTCAHKLST
jgi:hypothetical protein